MRKGIEAMSSELCKFFVHVPVMDNVQVLRQAATPPLCWPSQLTVPFFSRCEQSLKQKANPVGIFSGS